MFVFFFIFHFSFMIFSVSIFSFLFDKALVTIFFSHVVSPLSFCITVPLFY